MTASADGTVVLWDVATQKPIGAPLELDANLFVSAALSLDGKRLYAVSTGEDGISFDMSPGRGSATPALSPRARSAQASGSKQLPGRSYQAVCSGD
jgi:hypothetical protein